MRRLLCTRSCATLRQQCPPLVFYYNDVYEMPLPESHRFPMHKYRIVRERVQQSLQNNSAFHVSPLVAAADLVTTHDQSYVDRFISGTLTKDENRRIGFPWSQAGVDRALSSTGGTVSAAVAAAQALAQDRQQRRLGRAVEFPLITGHLAGGTHHAFKDRGEGYCVFSDIATAANVLRRDFPEVVKRIMVIDLDVHQGNGNASLFSDIPAVFTFSVHCTVNLFSKRQNSDRDVEVDAGMGDEPYLRLLRDELTELIKKHRPDIVFYQAGVDSSMHDRLGKLKLTREGLSRRNQMVYSAALQVGARVVVTMGGGYPRDLDPESEAFEAIVSAHADVYTDAARIVSERVAS